MPAVTRTRTPPWASRRSPSWNNLSMSMNTMSHCWHVQNLCWPQTGGLCLFLLDTPFIIAMSFNISRQLQFPVRTVMVETVSLVSNSCEKRATWQPPNFDRLEKRPSLFIVMVSKEKSQAAAMYLNKTITYCPHKVDMGAFHKQNMLFFWMPNCDKDVMSGVREVLSEENAQRHPQAIAVRRSSVKMPGGDLPFPLLSWRINPHSQELVLHVFSTELSYHASLDTAFPPLKSQVV